MHSKDEYERHALECFLLAEQTANQQQRLTLLMMAQAWLRLAKQAEKSSHLYLDRKNTPHEDGTSSGASMELGSKE